MTLSKRPYPEYATAKFLELEANLHAHFPGTKAEAVELARQALDPTVATADEIWPIIWNKPIHAGNNETGANNTVKKLAQYFSADWRKIALDFGDYAISHQGPINSNESFTAHGQIARKICRSDHEGKVVVGQSGMLMRARYYAIVSAAEWLKRQEVGAPAPAKVFDGADLRVLVPQLERELGIRWSHTTVLHLLTDLGLACKPDIHLTTVAKVLGFTEITSRDPKREEALQIVELTKALTHRLGVGYTLRYVHKTMFQISKHLFGTAD